MHARGIARAQLQHSEHRAICQRRTHLAFPRVLPARVGNGKAFARPDDRRRRAGPPLLTLERVVDADHRSSTRIVASHYSAYLHILSFTAVRYLHESLQLTRGPASCADAG